MRNSIHAHAYTNKTHLQLIGACKKTRVYRPILRKSAMEREGTVWESIFVASQLCDIGSK